MPGFTFPTVGRLGLTSPPSRSAFLSEHRYYDPLRLPDALLRFVRSLLSSPDTLPAFSFFGSRSVGSGLAQGKKLFRKRRGFILHGTAPLTPFSYKETPGSPKFPSYPFEHMPWSKTPVVTPALAISCRGLLPSVKSRTSAFSGTQCADSRIILTSTTIHISGLNIEPASLHPPASDSPCEAGPWVQLSRLGGTG